MKISLFTLIAVMCATPSFSEQFNKFELATSFRYWGNAENFRMEQAFQRIGLPDDGCWEDQNPKSLCVITLDRESERFPFCDQAKYEGKIPILVNPFSCKIADQVDNLIMLKLEKYGQEGSVKIDMYVCRHATGSDNWPEAFCGAGHDLDSTTVKNIFSGLNEVSELRQRIATRGLEN